MQEAFIRTRLAGYVEQVDKVASQVIANDWVANDARFLLYPAMKELTLDIASMVFMGHEPGTDQRTGDQGQQGVHHDHARGQRDHPHRRAAVHVVARPAGPQDCSRTTSQRGSKERRGTDGTDLLTVLCHSEDEDGNKFSDEDIVNHMIFLMMAAHDTSTSTATTMVYYLAANPEWQERCRDESDRLGDGPLDIEALEKLETSTW